MSVGGARLEVGCGTLQERNIEDATRHNVLDVDADGLANGGCDGHIWCHTRNNIGHSTRQGVDDSVAISLAASGRLSSRLSVCPPLARPAPGFSSFPSRFVPPPPAHFAFGGDDVGDRILSFPDVGLQARPLFFAVASVARPASCLSFSSAGSSSSHDSCHSAGSCRSPSQSVASSRRSRELRQNRCCSVSTHERACWLLSGYDARKGRDAVVARVMCGQRSRFDEGNIVSACACASKLNLELPSTDLDRMPSSPISKPRGHSTSNARWWSPASIQSSQKVILNRQVTVEDLCLVGTSVSDVGHFVVGRQSSGRQPQKLPCSLHNVLRLRGGGGDVRDVGSVVLADEAAGSGVGDDSSLRSEGGSGAVSVASAGVPAKEEDSMSNDIGHAFPIFIEGFGLGLEFKIQFLDTPPPTPRNDSSAFSARSSRVVDKDQDGSRGQSSIMSRGALSASSGNKVDAGGVKEELVARSSVACSPVASSLVACSPVASSSVARSRVARPSVVQSSFVPNPVSWLSPVVDGVRLPLVELRMLGRQWVSPQPISNEFSAWYRPNIRRPVLSRSSSLEVGPSSVGNAPRSVSVGEDDGLHIDRLQ